MGPSGAGKTTLLDVLAGRIRPTMGEVKVHGTVGYVMIDAKFHPWMTVRETLTFAARCQMPAEEVAGAVDLVLERTGLSSCADVAVGGGGVPGCSGGQRRRVAIALELLRNCDSLLCDEPTSGLDSISSELIIETLRDVADRSEGCVACTIHQPPAAVLAKFTHVILLTRGRIAYCGPLEAKAGSYGAISHFAGIGFAMPTWMNPARWWLRLLQDGDGGGDEFDDEGRAKRRSKRQRDRGIEAILRAWKDAAPPLPRMDECGLVSEVKPAGNFFQGGCRYAALAFAQLLRRQVKSAVRNRQAFYTTLLKTAVDLLNFALFFPQLDTSPQGVSALISFIRLVPTLQHFEACVRSAMPLMTERPILVREYRSGMYPITSYWLASMLSVSVSQFLWTSLLFGSAYPIVNMRQDVGAFILSFLALLLLLLSSQAFAVVLSCGVRGQEHIKQVHTALFAISFPFMLSNFGIRPQTAPVVLRPLFEISPFRHSLEAMLIVQLRDRELQECSEHEYGCFADGDAVLDSFGLADTPIWQPFLCLAAWIALLRGSALFLLRRSIHQQLGSGEVVGGQ